MKFSLISSQRTRTAELFSTGPTVANQLAYMHPAKSKSEGAADRPAERAVRAALLLQEALALLAADPEKAVASASGTGLGPSPAIAGSAATHGIRRSAIYEQIRPGIFHRSVKAGPRAATWCVSADRRWMTISSG